jgi:hypothetical protein
MKLKLISLVVIPLLTGCQRKITSVYLETHPPGIGYMMAGSKIQMDAFGVDVNGVPHRLKPDRYTSGTPDVCGASGEQIIAFARGTCNIVAVWRDMLSTVYLIRVIEVTIGPNRAEVMPCEWKGPGTAVC